MVRLIACITSALLLSGCGLIPRTGSPSEALQIADAMGIPAHDLSKADYTKMIAGRKVEGSGKNYDSAITGAFQLMGSGDPTMLLLSGLTARGIASNLQIVAWVPEDVASSPEQAVEVSSREFVKACANVIAKDEEQRQILLKQKVSYILGRPYGEGSPLHDLVQVYDLIADHTPSLVDAPQFMKTNKKVYGPIFLGAWGGFAKPEDIQFTLRKSEELPAWFYIYNPGLPGVAPSSVMNQGKHYLFLEP
jgi:hypothetical protein